MAFEESSQSEWDPSAELMELIESEPERCKQALDLVMAGVERVLNIAQDNRGTALHTTYPAEGVQRLVQVRAFRSVTLIKMFGVIVNDEYADAFGKLRMDVVDSVIVKPFGALSFCRTHATKGDAGEDWSHEPVRGPIIYKRPDRVDVVSSDSYFLDTPQSQKQVQHASDIVNLTNNANWLAGVLSQLGSGTIERP